MSIDNLLNRLESVRSSGEGIWKARCPSHDDKTPSLSIREVDDGRILIYCHAGCKADSVLSSIGLDLNDLFPRPLGDFKRVKNPFPAASILRSVGFEIQVIINTVNKVLHEDGINFVEKERLSLAVSRIQAAVNLSGVDT